LKPKGKIYDSAYVASNNSSDNGGVLITFVGCVSDDGQWILDSYCLHHVYINRDLFSTYEPI
jgi:hypothetical protein